MTQSHILSAYQVNLIREALDLSVNKIVREQDPKRVRVKMERLLHVSEVKALLEGDVSVSIAPPADDEPPLFYNTNSSSKPRPLNNLPLVSDLSLEGGADPEDARS